MKKISQVFKFMSKKHKKKTAVYVCDPRRNSKCAKEACWFIEHRGPCRCTGHKKYALRGDDGKPVIPSDDELYNLEYWDERIKEMLHEKSQKKQGL